MKVRRPAIRAIGVVGVAVLVAAGSAAYAACLKYQDGPCALAGAPCDTRCNFQSQCDGMRQDVPFTVKRCDLIHLDLYGYESCPKTGTNEDCITLYYCDVDTTQACPTDPGIWKCKTLPNGIVYQQRKAVPTDYHDCYPS